LDWTWALDRRSSTKGSVAGAQRPRCARGPVPQNNRKVNESLLKHGMEIPQSAIAAWGWGSLDQIKAMPLEVVLDGARRAAGPSVAVNISGLRCNNVRGTCRAAFRGGLPLRKGAVLMTLEKVAEGGAERLRLAARSPGGAGSPAGAGEDADKRGAKRRRMTPPTQSGPQPRPATPQPHAQPARRPPSAAPPPAGLLLQPAAPPPTAPPPAAPQPAAPQPPAPQQEQDEDKEGEELQAARQQVQLLKQARRQAQAAEQTAIKVVEELRAASKQLSALSGVIACVRAAHAEAQRAAVQHAAQAQAELLRKLEADLEASQEHEAALRGLVDKVAGQQGWEGKAAVLKRWIKDERKAQHPQQQ
jgi:hypothetical protein